MNNEHNPIYRKVEKLRELWTEKTSKVPGYSIARWLMVPDDVDLLVGLLKLESTPHGQLPEVFVILISPFVSMESFSYDLVKDWIQMYIIDKEKNQGNTYDWNYSYFEDKLNELGQTTNADDLLIEMLNNFKEYINNDDRLLVFGLIPQSVSYFSEYNQWLKTIVSKNQLNPGIKILVLDHCTKGYLDVICNSLPEKVITLEPGDMDTFGAMKKIATQGNPNDPQIQMRKCIFEMSDAVSSNNKEKLYRWGEEIIKVGQHSGMKSMYASVHLIYSGFLMQYQESEKINDLLERGIKIARSALPAQTDCIPVLIQLYAFKGSNYALAKEYKSSIEWYINQANLCIEFGMPSIAISAYKNAIIIADKNRLTEEYIRCTKSGYESGKEIYDEEVKLTEYSFVAYHYYFTLKEYNTADAENVRNQMIAIYGPDWESSSERMVQQMKSKKTVEFV